MKKKRKRKETSFEKGVIKTEKVINLLKNYSLKLSKDPRTDNLVKDPLRELTGNEDLQEAANKIGYERLIGILQSYSIVSKYYIRLMKREKGSIEYSNIEKDIEGIYSKLNKIEGHLIRYNSSGSKSSNLDEKIIA